MKKKLLMAFVFVSAFMLTTNVNAMTEAELKDKLTTTYTINGRTEKLDKGIVTQIERYFNTYEVSSKDCDYIAAKIDEAVALVEKGNAIHWADLSTKEKESLVKIVDDITNKTSVKASLSKGGELTIYNADGTVFTKVSGLIKYTDNSKLGILVVGAISLVGLLLITKKVVKANA